MQAIIFDLDGTLVHSAPDLHAAAVAMLGDLGRPGLTLAQVTGFIGNGVPKLVQRCLAATGGIPEDGGKAALEIFSAHYSRHPTRLSRVYDGVRQMLAALGKAGIGLGVCTNKPEAMARLVLDQLGIGEAITALVGGDTLTVRKPDPEPLRHCLRLLGAESDRAIYVGDSETDAETAGNLRLRFALFSGGYRKSPIEAMRADFVFSDFAALTREVLG